MPEPSVAIIILNWENWPATSRCLASLTALEQWGRDGLSLLIVDNGSRDESINRIRRWAEERPEANVTLIENTANLGFAAGNNAALEHALALPEPPDFIWLLNNDTRVEAGTLTALLAASGKHAEVKIWGSSLLREDGETLEYGGGGKYVPLLGLEINPHAGESVRDLGQQAEVGGLDFVCAASMLARRSVFEMAGLLNPEFFLYYEELDLCRRLDRPREIAWCPQSLVVHEQGGSTADSRRGLKTRQYHENLSTFKFTAIHYWYFLPPVLLLRALVKPPLFLLRGELFLLTPLLRAYGDFFRWIFSRQSRPLGTP
jgi:GT2 family glycosyltransferase